MQAGLSTQNAPSPTVVVPHFVFGAVSFLIATVMMLLVAPDLIYYYHLNARMLSLTHILVLGFVTMVIFGALYQLIPVVMEVKLFSEKLAKTTFYLFGPGIVILVISFWNATFDNTQNWYWFWLSGALLLLSVMIFVFNTLMSASKTERRDMGNRFVIAAILYLLLTVSMAILLIVNLAVPFIPVSVLGLLKMHLSLGLVGWFLMLVIGVSSKLMPMFLIIHKLPEHLLDYSFYVLNAGLLLLVSALYFYPEPWLLMSFSAVIFVGVIIYLRYIRYAFKHRFRKNLDVGMKITAMAFILFAIILILGILVVLDPDFLSAYHIRISIAFGASFLLGFLTAIILGQTYKTLPFIIWLQRYQSKVGKIKVPLPHELYSAKLAKIHGQTYFPAFLLLITGILFAWVVVIQIAAVLFFITALLYNINVFKIVFHKQKIQDNE